MAIYAISDLHLSLTKEKPMDSFGEVWRNHSEKILTNWRDTVGEEDTVLMPGDLSWAKNANNALPDLEFVASLPGRKIISRGNHDLFWRSHAKMAQMLPPGIIAVEQTVTIVEGYAVTGVKGWLTPHHPFYNPEVDEKYFLRERGRLERSLTEAAKYDLPLIALLHFPPSYSYADPGFTDLLTHFGVRYCIYGHLHNGDWQNQTEGLLRGVYYHLVSADYLKFKPKRIGFGLPPSSKGDSSPLEDPPVS